MVRFLASEASPQRGDGNFVLPRMPICGIDICAQYVPSGALKILRTLPKEMDALEQAMG